MNLFSKRPLLLAFSIFIVTSLIASVIGDTARNVCLALACVLFAVSIIAYTVIKKSNKRLIFNVALCLCFSFVAVLSSFHFFNLRLAKAESLSGDSQITARIDETAFSASYTTVYKAKLLSVNDKNANFYIELTSLGATEFEKGDILKTNATFYPFNQNRFGFNERKTNVSNNVLAYAEFEDAEIIEKASNSINNIFADLRGKLSSRFDYFDKNSSGLMKALLLGDRSELEGGLTLNFRRMGISHILSISGTHFTILLGVLALILSALGFNKKVTYFVLIFVAIFYMGLAGFSEAVCRAGIMAIIAYLSFLLGRTGDSYTALAFAVVLILLLSPNAVMSISLWLSFTATLAILVLNELLSGIKKWFKKLGIFTKLILASVTTLLLSTFISIITLPIVAAVFGEISLISPLCNLIIVPLITIFLYLAPLCLLFPKSYLIAFICDWLYELISKFCNFICQTDNLLVSLKYPFILPISIICAVTFVCMLAIPLKRKSAVLLPPLISVILLSILVITHSHLNFDSSFLTYYVQGGNDGIVITSENECMCIDISSGASDSAYRAEYIAEENYCPEISAFMFTHCHSLHINMFAKLCNRTNIHAVYLPKSESDTQGYILSVADVAKENGVEIFWFDYGTPIDFNGCKIIVFSPVYISRSTHPVICLEISNEKDVLYLGSSFNDTKIDYSDYVSTAETIIFGQHSPLAKKEYEFDCSAELIYGNYSVWELSKTENNGEILKENGEYRLSLK